MSLNNINIIIVPMNAGTRFSQYYSGENHQVMITRTDKEELWQDNIQNTINGEKESIKETITLANVVE